MKNSNIIVGAIVLILVFAVSVIGWFAFKPADVILQGELEATEINVSTKLTGRIIQKLVSEGQTVKVGDTLLKISSPEIDAKLNQVMAARNAAEAQSAKANNGARKEQVVAAYNIWMKVKAASDLMEKTYKRVNNLYKDGVLAAQKNDEVETQMTAARMTEAAAKSNYEMVKSGTRYEDKAAANALVEQANAAIEEVESYLDETSIIAPAAGEIARINANQGELITAGYPVVNITDLNDHWFTFNIREDYLYKFEKGKKFTVSIPALKGQEVELEVNYLQVHGNYATWRATKAQGDFDKKVFEVRAVTTSKVEGLRPGMSALINWSLLGE